MKLTSMTENTKDSSLRDQIYDNMRLKETDELVEIWKRGDPAEWSDTTFEVIKEILLERLGEIPPQELATEKESPNDEPLHSEEKMMKISSWANFISWVILIGYAISFLNRLVTTFQEFSNTSGVSMQNPTLTSFTTQLNLWVSLFLSPAIGIAYFLLLQAISQGILMLFDLEDNGSQVIDIFKAVQKSSHEQ